MKILAIESSCDETAASVVEDGKRVFLCRALYKDEAALVEHQRVRDAKLLSQLCQELLHLFVTIRL